MILKRLYQKSPSPRFFLCLLIVLLLFWVFFFSKFFANSSGPAKCIAFSSNGCPVLQDSARDPCKTQRQERSMSLPLKRDCSGLSPVLIEEGDSLTQCKFTIGNWFANKFILKVSSTSPTKDWLATGVCLYLLRDENTFTNYVTDIICNGAKDLDPEFASQNLTQELLFAVTESVGTYFSYYWQKHPYFQETLPEGHPLLTPPELLTDPDREEWRRRLKSSILSSGETFIQKLRKPRFLIIAGGGGSGKSSVLAILKATQRLVPLGAYVLINPDLIKQKDPVYQAIINYGDSRAADIVHKESNNLAEEIFREGLQKRYELVYDGTFSDLVRGKRFIEAAREEGYEVVMVGVTADPALSLRRSLERAVSSKRLVPARDLLSAHKKFSANFEKYLKLVDRALLCETFKEEGATTINLIASKKIDGRLRILNQLAYKRFLQKSQLNVNAEWEMELYVNEPSELMNSQMLRRFYGCPSSMGYPEFDRYLYLLHSFNPLIGNVCLCDKQNPHAETP